jgi:hypothetical protein
MMNNEDFYETSMFRLPHSLVVRSELHALRLATYYPHAWGKSAVASIYPAGTNAQFGYLETNFHF